MEFRHRDVFSFGFSVDGNVSEFMTTTTTQLTANEGRGGDAMDEGMGESDDACPMGPMMNSSQATYEVIDELYPTTFVHRELMEVIVKVTMYCVIISLSLVGNCIVIYIVWRTKRMHTATNYFLVNLSVSDLMITALCSWVHLVDNLSEGWILGHFFCKFNSFAQVVSLVSSILTLILIACDRFFGIVFAMKAHITERRSSLFVGVVWLGAVGVASPLLFYRQQFTRRWLDHEEVWCDDTWPPTRVCDRSKRSWLIFYPLRTAYYTFVSTVLYVFPILIMSAVYSTIIWKLWSSRMPGERTELEIKHHDNVKKKVIVMLLILLSVFVVCWLPLHVAILFAEFRLNNQTQALRISFAVDENQTEVTFTAERETSAASTTASNRHCLCAV